MPSSELVAVVSAVSTWNFLLHYLKEGLVRFWKVKTYLHAYRVRTAQCVGRVMLQSGNLIVDCQRNGHSLNIFLKPCHSRPRVSMQQESCDDSSKGCMAAALLDAWRDGLHRRIQAGYGPSTSHAIKYMGSPLFNSVLTKKSRCGTTRRLGINELHHVFHSSHRTFVCTCTALPPNPPLFSIFNSHLYAAVIYCAYSVLKLKAFFSAV